MNNFINRFLLVSILVSVVVSPLYLYLKFNIPGVLFLYAPVVGVIVAFWLESMQERE